MNFHIITLFPETIEPYLASSIIGRAVKSGVLNIKYYNPRDFALSLDKTNKNNIKMSYEDRRVDARPYGGGPGMVIEAMPIIRAIENIKKHIKKSAKTKIIFLTPSGKQFTNNIADGLKKYTDIILVCGRYEGVDARIKKIFPMMDISVGPYVLTGGELPAMIVVDTLARRIPGVLGDDASLEENRTASPIVYTRPQVISYKGKNYKVPKILLSGHHKDIDEWRSKNKFDSQ